MSAPLCDAVTATSGSQALLEEIERSNYFLIPLDRKRRWYRYHHLFGELLQHELERSEPELVPELHGRASVWFETEGSVPEAIRHALAANRSARARALVVSHWNAFFNQGRLETVAGWLDALGPGAVSQDARLCLARVWLAMDGGRLDEADTWIDAAARALSAPSASREAVAGVEGEVALVRALHRFKSGDIGRSIEAVRSLDTKQRLSTFARTVENCIEGVATFWRGDADRALAALQRAVRLARSDGNDLATVYALGYLAVIHAEGGDAPATEDLVRDATPLAEEPGVAEHFVAMMTTLARARVMEGAGQLDDASTLAARAVELSRRGAGRLEVAYALLSLARVQRERGEADHAKDALEEARRIVERCPDPGVVSDMLAAMERRPGRARAAAEAPPYPAPELSDREHAVLRLLTGELSQREIASALHVSINTVKTHTRAIFQKLGASSRAEAVARARDRGLL